jgi:hypothetical protein
MSLSVSLLPKQAIIFNPQPGNSEDIALYVGGVGSGKSFTGTLLGLTLCRKYPGLNALVTADTYTLIRDSTRKIWEELLDPDLILSWTRTPDILRFKNGSTVTFKHAGENLKSAEYGFIHIEEGSQLDYDRFIQVLARLRQKARPEWGSDFRLRLIITTNPEESPGWLDRTFKRREKQDARFRVVTAPTSENLHLMASNPGYLSMLQNSMDDEMQRIYLEGETGNLGAGYVYYKFAYDKHVSDTAVYDPAIPLCLSMDFNVSFMYASIWQKRRLRRINQKTGATEFYEVAWCIDEIAHKRSSDTQAVCDEFLRRYTRHMAGVHVYGDPSGFSRDTRSARNDYDIVRSSLSALPGFVFYVSGNDAARMDFRIRNRTVIVNKLFENGDIVINPSCKYMIRSMQETRWETGKGESWSKHKVSSPDSDDFVVDHPGDTADYFFAKEFSHMHVAIMR